MDTLKLCFDALVLKYEGMRMRIPSKESKLLLSLEEYGQQNPIVVVQGNESGRYIVIDGYKRVRCLKRLRADVVKAVLWDMEEPQALMMVYQMTARGCNLFEESWLIHELHVVWGWDLKELSAAFGHSKSWISQRLGLVKDLPSWIHDKIRQGEIGGHIGMRYLLPFARANISDCQRLVEKISGKGLSSRQVGQLYEHYKSSNHRVRQRLIEEPLKFLKAKAEVEKGIIDLNLSEIENRCLKNLRVIGQMAEGLVNTLNKVINYDTSDDMRSMLAQSWSQALRSIDRLSRAMDRTLSDRPSRRPFQKESRVAGRVVAPRGYPGATSPG